tara:strand:+ start:3144 stop:5168 length:2025 start_codon:yes stop_codon:yes gene_type:complete
MRTKNITIFIIFLVVLLPFTISSRNDNISAKVLDLSTVGYYQSTTCNISFFEFIFENLDNDIPIYYNNNDYADINCFGKITGVDLNNETFFVSIGTNTSINLILQSSIWLLMFYLIPAHTKTNKLKIASSFLIPLIFTFQLFSEERFYARTNILYDSNISSDNFYIFANAMLYLLVGLICYDLLSLRYKNLINYIPFTFIFVGTYSGMNLNIFLIILSFFGLNSIFSKKYKRFDLIYFIFSIFWIINTDSNDYFFDGDKLRGFINSNYTIYSQLFWLIIFYLSFRGILFLIDEGIDYFDNKLFVNNLLISGSLVLFLGLLGSSSPTANFLNFFIFGQNKRGMKTPDSVDGNAWRGFSASAESVGEFYGFIILFLFIFIFIKKEVINLKQIILLLPIVYGLYKSNNFASFIAVTSIIFLLIVYTFISNRKLEKHFFKILSLLLILFVSVFLINSDYQYLSTELIFESTFHQGFYENPGSYTNYMIIENKMYERDLKSMLLNEQNLNEASSSYKFLVNRFTSDLNIPFVPNLIAFISVISLLINRTEMWGIFIAKYDPNLIETAFGSGPLQINEYLYGEKVFLDVPFYKLQSLFLPHSSLLDLLIFFGAGGVLILSCLIFWNIYKSDKKNIFLFPAIFLIINFLKSDSFLYFNSFLLIIFSIVILSKDLKENINEK